MGTRPKIAVRRGLKPPGGEGIKMDWEQEFKERLEEKTEGKICILPEEIDSIYYHEGPEFYKVIGINIAGKTRAQYYRKHLFPPAVKVLKEHEGEWFRARNILEELELEPDQKLARRLGRHLGIEVEEKESFEKKRAGGGSCLVYRYRTD